MEELKPEDLQELVQELQEESSLEEALPPELEQLLRDLQPARRFTARLRAARQLGEVSIGSRQIVQSLATVAELDDSDEVRAVASESLRAPVHQVYVQEYLERKKAIDVARQQRLVRDTQAAETKRDAGRSEPEQESRIPIQCLKSGAIAGLVIGLVIGYWWAGVALRSEDGPSCGVPFLLALTIGAAVGAPVGAVAHAEERGGKDRGASIAVGAISAAVVASLSWVPVLLFRVVLLGGP
jgi:hypothetical protein